MSLPTVLVVDDDRELADLYAAWLDERYVVHTAYGGQEALDTVSELGSDLDAILLDRRMPDVTGDLVLVVLRDRGVDLPVAMVTAVEPDVDVLELGFDDYLVKPASQADLFDLVESLLALGSLDSVVRELSMLRVKRNVLSVELSAAERNASPAFAALERKIRSLQRTLAAHPSTMGSAAD